MPSSDVWGAFAQRQLVRMPLGWLDTEWVLRDRVFPLVFGKDPGGWWTADAMAALGIPTGGRWLDLGCGGGGAEIVMAQNGLFSRMVAYDPSPGAIDVARRQAAEAGISTIEFYQADVNTIELPEASFDVVHVNMALHHVRELEYVLYQANRALKPDGLFIANEFVGPSQFQFSTERMAEVTRCLNGLPERLRWNPIANEMKTAQPVYPRSWWNRWDPTEAVRSDEIPALIDFNFTEPRRIDYGGNLLNLVFENIAQNFDPTDPADRELIAGLFRAEDSEPRARAERLRILRRSARFSGAPRSQRFACIARSRTVQPTDSPGGRWVRFRRVATVGSHSARKPVRLRPPLAGAVNSAGQGTRATRPAISSVPSR